MLYSDRPKFDFVDRIKRSYRQKLNWIRRGVFYRIGIERYYNLYRDIINSYGLRSYKFLRDSLPEIYFSLGLLNDDSVSGYPFEGVSLEDFIYFNEFVFADLEGKFSLLYDELPKYKLIIRDDDRFYCYNNGLRRVVNVG